MIVVSDASPLLALSGVDQIHLLRALFGQVVVPMAVAHEVASLSLPSWIEVREVQDTSRVTLLKQRLDDGEAEALTLALELKAERVLIDERKARRVASEMGLAHVGVLGILVEAKRGRLIESVRPLLDALRKDVGFWIAPDLLRRVLEAAGET